MATRILKRHEQQQRKIVTRQTTGKGPSPLGRQLETPPKGEDFHILSNLLYNTNKDFTGEETDEELNEMLGDYYEKSSDWKEDVDVSTLNWEMMSDLITSFKYIADINEEYKQSLIPFIKQLYKQYVDKGLEACEKHLLDEDYNGYAKAYNRILKIQHSVSHRQWKLFKDLPAPKK